MRLQPQVHPGAPAALRHGRLPVLRRRRRTLPILPGAADRLSLDPPFGFRRLFRRGPFHFPDPFERGDALAGDGLELGAELGRVVGDELRAVARPADLDPADLDVERFLRR